MTGKQVVTDFLIQKQNQTIDYLTLEKELKTYAEKQGKYYRVDSLQRYFRWVVEEKLLTTYNLEIVEVKGKYKTWMVQSIYPLFAELK